jgi:hypothetical protein
MSRPAKLSPEDVKALCDAAKEAWNAAPPTAKKVRFLWRGRRYISVLTSFRMLVQTPEGEPVCDRFHD